MPLNFSEQQEVVLRWFK